MRYELRLDHACERLPLPAGAVIHCRRGSLWLTQEPRRAAGPSPDIVLLPGQHHRTAEAGDYFLAHLGPDAPACCVVDLPARRRAPWRWPGARRAFNLR